MVNNFVEIPQILQLNQLRLNKEEKVPRLRLNIQVRYVQSQCRPIDRPKCAITRSCLSELDVVGHR